MSSNFFQERRSYRKFIADQPVSKALLDQVLADAMRAPSWANSQPWDVYVVAGDAMNKLREDYLASHDNHEPENTEMAAPLSWPMVHLNRMRLNSAYLFQTMDIDRYNTSHRQDNWRRNFIFFDAPAAVFLCMHKDLSEWSTLDVGIFAGYFMLACEAHGLQTIPAYSSVVYPHHIRRIAGIPDQLKIITGILVGHAEPGHRFNRPKTTRAPIDELVTYIE